MVQLPLGRKIRRTTYHHPATLAEMSVQGFKGNSVPRIEKAQRAYNGRLFDAESLGEILYSAGRRICVHQQPGIRQLGFERRTLDQLGVPFLPACAAAESARPARLLLPMRWCWDGRWWFLLHVWMHV